MHTTMIRASMTAYSTAVGPSSFLRKLTRFLVMAFIGHSSGKRVCELLWRVVAAWSGGSTTTLPRSRWNTGQPAGPFFPIRFSRFTYPENSCPGAIGNGPGSAGIPNRRRHDTFANQSDDDGRPRPGTQPGHAPGGRV